MPRKFLTSIDLTNFELLNAKAHQLGSDPTGLGGGDEGLFWWNTASNRLKVWDGSAAGLLASDSDLLQGQNSAYHLSRTNHSGTQLSSTISDLDAAIDLHSLDDLADAGADLNIGGFKLTNGAAATADTDYPIYSQLLALAQGHDFKDSVRAASTANVTLASAVENGDTLDGVVLATGNRILLKNQTDPIENGIYVVAASGAPARSLDANSAGDLSGGTIVPVEEGTANADTAYWITTNGSITPGTTSHVWTLFGPSAGETILGGAGLLKTGSTLDVGAGTGIAVAADSVAADFTIVGRKLTAVIPSGTTGAFTVSGAVVTWNHALNNLAAALTLVYYSSPGGGNTQGDLIEAQVNNSDANNTVITLPGAPSANQYYASVIG